MAVPELRARVTDLTGTLSAAQQEQLENALQQFEVRKGSQVAVLLVPTTAPETVEQYGIRVAEQWKLGRTGVDDGALLLVAKEDRTVRIEVGYGLEGVLPDAIAKRIIEEDIVPRFKQGDFAGGIEAGVNRMIRVVDGEPLPPPARGSGKFFPILFFGFVVFMLTVARGGGGVRSSGRGGGWTGGRSGGGGFSGGGGGFGGGGASGRW